jgi:hypothetical protein
MVFIGADRETPSAHCHSVVEFTALRRPANAGVTLITVLGAPVCDLDPAGTEERHGTLSHSNCRLAYTPACRNIDGHASYGCDV